MTQQNLHQNEKHNIERALEAYLTPAYELMPSQPMPSDVIWRAMRYSALEGSSKRLRPLLLLAACADLGGDESIAMPFACAIEMIHTYSLIHDDLPAMDNDELRRGMPTCHIAFGEAIAILAGDGLLNRAFEVMADACAEIDQADESFCNKRAQAMAVVAKSAGCMGMIGGQTADVINENKTVDTDTLLYIHRHKTSALFEACLTAGAILAGADHETVSKLRDIGRTLGLAFQIKDDILDLTSDAATLGKPVMSDEKNKKNTYVSVFGLEKAKDEYTRLSAMVEAELGAYPRLAALAQGITQRSK